MTYAVRRTFLSTKITSILEFSLEFFYLAFDNFRSDLDLIKTILHQQLIWQVSDKLGVIYLITKLGYVHIHDLESGTFIYTERLASAGILMSVPFESHGVIMVKNNGDVFSVNKVF